jgi:uncharacterized Ntn-hydrolase superfamily protein
LLRRGDWPGIVIIWVLRNAGRVATHAAAREDLMTFSLLGISPRMRAFGSVVASSSFGVGGWVICGAAGQGLAVIQGYTDPRLGPVALEALMAADGNATSAVAAMRRAAGREAAWRQMAVVDRGGGLASFTGERCPAPSGEAFGPGCVAIGAAVASQRVLLEMVAMFASGADDPFGDTLLEALVAGVRAGGDRFPFQSAALRIYQPGLAFPYADLRVDFSPNPVTDLRVLWSLWATVVDGYTARAMSPSEAPEEGALEGHRVPQEPS